MSLYPLFKKSFYLLFGSMWIVSSVWALPKDSLFKDLGLKQSYLIRNHLIEPSFDLIKTWESKVVDSSLSQKSKTPSSTSLSLQSEESSLTLAGELFEKQQKWARIWWWSSSQRCTLSSSVPTVVDDADEV